MKRFLLLFVTALMMCGLVYFAYQYKQLAQSNSSGTSGDTEDISSSDWLPIETLTQSTSRFPSIRRPALEEIESNWRPEYSQYLIECVRIGRTFGPDSPRDILTLLESKTDQKFGVRMQAWMSWGWEQNFEMPKNYPEFKQKLFELKDKRFASYFSNDRQTTINLQEVVWGGVDQDEIPPLRKPAVVPPDQADYLADTDVVFGIEINGDARAYPKRILAHHEMFTDTIGGVSVCGVY